MGSSVQVVERTTVPESRIRQLASSTMLTRLLILVCFLAVPCPSIPAPQTSETDYGDDYGDYDASVKGPASSPSDGLADLLKMGAGIAQGLMAIFNNKVNFLVSLLSDKELQDAVGTTVGAGVNLTGQLTRAAVPVAQGIVGAVPSLVGQGSRLVGSVIRAANDTAPLVLDGITEFTDQLPLIAGFASAYAEVNAEQTQKVVQTFSRSLSCNLECDDMTDPQEKAECEEKYCKELEEEDDYDYRR